jgi:hypothetical protein
MSILRFKLTTALLGVACAMVASRSDAATTVTQILPQPGIPAVGPWYESGVQAGGTIGIVNLTGVGGNLETAQPLPTGAGKITTSSDNSSRAQAFTYNDFGDAASFLSNVTLGYNYYKTTNLSNISAAPSLKLNVQSLIGTGDNFGTLIYEPYWNQSPGDLVPDADAWQAVSIPANAGSGDDNHGGWWWSGGFEIGSGAGGPPLRSLTEWAAAFQASDALDFATARVTAIGIGEGTFNVNEVGYFDNISYAVIGGPSETWDFQAVPEPASLAMAGVAAVAGLAVRRRTRKA